MTPDITDRIRLARERHHDAASNVALAAGRLVRRYVEGHVSELDWGRLAELVEAERDADEAWAKSLAEVRKAQEVSP